MVTQTIQKLGQEFSTLRTSLAVQWLRFCAVSAGGTGSIPGQRTKSPHAMQDGQKVIIKKTKEFRTFNSVHFKTLK